MMFTPAQALLASLTGLCLLAGCATLPPGADFPKTVSMAFEQPRTTTLGRQAAAQADAHPGLSGFHLFPRGVDGLLVRTQIVRAAQRSLDIQYFIFVEDFTGKLLLESMLLAADRGVRIRLLIDDLNSFGHPETRATLAALNEHRNIEIRLFNPFAYRGNNPLLRRLDFVLNAPRVNHRMHNKLLVADGAVAIVGGRNVGDEYFETGALTVRFGDFDVAAMGPVVPGLEQSFDAYWNCALAIPQEAVAPVAEEVTPAEARASLRENRVDTDVPQLVRRLDAGDPLAGMMAGRVALSWASAVVVADPPAKADPPDGDAYVSPTEREIRVRMNDVADELIIISPYFIPGPDGLVALEDARKRGARVRVLTNSLASTDVPVVHSAYQRYRQPLLESGVELFEVRPVPGQPRGSRDSGIGSGGSGGGSSAPFALHAKAYVFDRQRVFVGSANLDPRSQELNTEVGLLIESPDLARQVIARFDEFAASSNSYRVVRSPGDAFGPVLRWRTSVDGRQVVWSVEPDTTLWQRLKVDFMSFLPSESQL